MGKYYPLERHLLLLSGKTATMTFNQVERIIGDVLPPAALNWRGWWANDETHIHALAWLNAGWSVQKVDAARKVVTFVVSTL